MPNVDDEGFYRSSISRSDLQLSNLKARSQVGQNNCHGNSQYRRRRRVRSLAMQAHDWSVSHGYYDKRKK